MGDPRGTMWHELYPNYCTMWELTSWHDNGDGILSASDTIDFTNQDTDEVVWEHVKLVAPTITVTKVSDPAVNIYLDELDPNPMVDPITDPTGTFWHEVYPVYCLKYQIESWEDNGSGDLDSCDYIQLRALSGPDSGTTELYHVEGLETDIVTEPLPTPGTNKHNLDDYRPSDGDPRGTMWHELYPNYCTMWELTSWHDNGDGILSFCDTVDFTNLETEEVIWEHIESVTPTITVTKVSDPGVNILMDQLGQNPLIEPIPDPLGTYWHEVYPNYCRRYRVESWEDNGSGDLDSCDYIELLSLNGPDSNTSELYHVEGLETDIVTTPLCVCGNPVGDLNCDGGLNPIDVVYAVNYVYKGLDGRCYADSWNCSYDLGDVNCDGSVNPVDVVYYVNCVYKSNCAFCDDGNELPGDGCDGGF